MEDGITIFTPTYNRAYCLSVLYQSLCRQTSRQFEWLIIDDGSEDGTEELVAGWRKEHKIRIRCFRQENAGKAQAHNRGVEMAGRRLFTCVDSDDMLVPEAVERILELWEAYPDKTGIISLRAGMDGRAAGRWKGRVSYCTLYDAYREYGLKGEAMLIYPTKLLQKYRFPVFQGEKFVTEAYLYDQLDQEGKMYITEEAFCLSEYLPDGYTAGMGQILKKNPYGHQAYIMQRLKLDKKMKYKAMDTVLYIWSKRMLRDHRLIRDAVFPVLTCLLWMPSVVYYKVKDVFLLFRCPKREHGKKRKG